MDILTFITKIIESTIWPITVIVVAMIFKRPLHQLFPNLLRLKWKEFHLEFNQEVAELKQEAEKRKIPNISADSDLNQKKEKLFELSITFPRAAIVEAWTELEAAIGNKLQEQKIITKGEKTSGRVSYLNAAKDLFANDNDSLQFFYQLQTTRNKVIHASEYSPSAENAMGLIELTFRLIEKINKAQQSALPDPQTARAR